MNILIVEDDPFIAMDLEDTFAAEGYTVLGPVAAVDQGLEIIDKTTPTLAILDYNLGCETSIPIAKALHDADVPFLFLSGQIERVVVDNSFPPRQVISKPFIPSNLVQAVKALESANNG